MSRALIYLIVGALAVLKASSARAEDEPDGGAAALLAAARSAGTEASSLVFDDAALPDAADERRVSGKTILLATTIASAALVTTAWLISRNSGGCRRDSVFSRSLEIWTSGVSGRQVTLEDGTRIVVPGPEPHPPLLPPGAGFPDLCVAR